MQFRKPVVFLAALGLCAFLIQTSAAYQNSSNTSSSTSPQTPAGKSSGTSQTTVTVPPPDPPKAAADASAAGKNNADTPQGEGNPTKSPTRVSVNEVIVPVTVTDDKGRFVSDLDKRDFHIFEENKRLTVLRDFCARSNDGRD